MKPFHKDWPKMVAAVCLSAFNLQSLFASILLNQPVGMLFNFIGLLLGLHMLFTIITAFPSPYAFDVKYYRLEKSLLKKMLFMGSSVLFLPFEVMKAWRYYKLGASCGVYRDTNLIRYEKTFQTFTELQVNIIIGYFFAQGDKISDGYLSELNYRVDCIRNMEDEREYDKFVHFDDGFKFGVYTIEETFAVKFDRYHVIRCSTCGSRVSVSNEVIATKLLKNCQDHLIVPKLG